MVALARYAERLGYDSVWIPDERFYRDVYQICAAIASATDRVSIGPCVTDPYTRHPALTAVSIATLDEISGGRAALGIGAGISGFRELGIDRPHAARAVCEAVTLIRSLLSGARTTSRGRVVRFDGKLDFAPPRPSVPVLVAAAGPRMLATAAAVGDGVILQAQMTAAELDASVRIVKAAAERSAREPAALRYVARVDISVADDLDVAYAALRPRVARILTREWPTFRRFASLGLEVPSDLAERSAGIGFTHDVTTLAPVAERVPAAFVDAFCVAATPHTLADRLAVLRERSLDELIVNPVPARGDEIEPIIEAVAAWSGSQ